MMKKICLLFAIAVGLSAPSAFADTFGAAVEGNTVGIFSRSDKEDVCNVWVAFSFWHEGKREYTTTTCPDRPIVISSDWVEVCRVTDPVIVNPKIEGPVEFKCGK